MRRKLRKLSLLAGLAAVFLVFTGLTSVSESRWEFAGWYGGGYYPNVEFDPNTKDRVYLASDVAGLWRSDDLGENWKPINKGLGHLGVAMIVPAPSDPSVVYAGTKGGLFVSRNAGEEWTACANPKKGIIFNKLTNYRSLAIHSKNPAQICIGTASGAVLCSEDYGAVWNALGNQQRPFDTDQPVTALIYGKEDRTLFAASAAGVMKYSFSNGNWETLSKSPRPVTDLFFLTPEQLLSAGPSGLFMSEDEGNNWKQISSQADFVRLAALKEGESSAIIGVWERNWQGGVLISRDLGRSWSSADSKMNADKKQNPTRSWARAQGRTKAVKADPFNPKVLMRTDWWGVWRSDDGGLSWNEKIRGAGNTVGSDLFITPKNILYASMMDDGLLRSADGGKNYEGLLPRKRFQKNLNGHFWRVLVFGKDEQKIVVTSSPWEQNLNQVLVSTDGGKKFQPAAGLPAERPKQNTVWAEGYPRALAKDPQNEERLFLGIDGEEGGLFISEDGGFHWKASPGQPDSKKIYNALGVDPKDPNRIYWGAVGEQGGVYLSEDGGKSWKLVFDQSKWIFDLTVSPDGKVYLGTDTGGAALFVSEDRGVTWRMLAKFPESGTAEALAVNSKDPQIMALSTHAWDEYSGGKIYLTRDGGENWTDVTGNLPNGAGAAASVFDSQGSHLYAASTGGSIYRLKL